MNNFSIFQLKFNDFDHFAEMISQADLDHSQLDSGTFKGELSQVICGPLIISTHRMNRIILQNGIGIKGHTTFLIPGNLEQDFHWRKNRMRGDIIGILRSNMEHNSVTPSNFFSIAVSIENNFLGKFSSLLGFSDFNKLIQQNESVLIDKTRAIQLHRISQCICNSKITDTSAITFDLPKLIIEAISESSSNYKFIKGKGRANIFKKAQDIIHSNTEEPINPLFLCKEIGVSERNLRYAFKEQSGLSPNKYVQRYKLNMVRKLLQTGKYEKIMDVSNQFGFWHSGQFAADFKKLFGELPSELID